MPDNVEAGGSMRTGPVNPFIAVIAMVTPGVIEPTGADVDTGVTAMLKSGGGGEADDPRPPDPRHTHSEQ